MGQAIAIAVMGAVCLAGCVVDVDAPPGDLFALAGPHARVTVASHGSDGPPYREANVSAWAVLDPNAVEDAGVFRMTLNLEPSLPFGRGVRIDAFGPTEAQICRDVGPSGYAGLFHGDSATGDHGLPTMNVAFVACGRAIVARGCLFMPPGFADDGCHEGEAALWDADVLLVPSDQVGATLGASWPDPPSLEEADQLRLYLRHDGPGGQGIEIPDYSFRDVAGPAASREQALPVLIPGSRHSVHIQFEDAIGAGALKLEVHDSTGRAVAAADIGPPPLPSQAAATFRVTEPDGYTVRVAGAGLYEEYKVTGTTHLERIVVEILWNDLHVGPEARSTYREMVGGQ